MKTKINHDYDNGHLLESFPYWVGRAYEDHWAFAISLKNGDKIKFNEVISVESFDDGDKWLHLSTTGDFDIDETINYLVPEGSDRGIWVRLSEVASFWERADT